MTRSASTPFRSTAASRALEWIGVPGFFAVASGIFFHRLLTGQGAYVALDMVGIHVPFRTFLKEAIGSHQIPLWNPQLYMGMPFLANGDAAVLYPFQVLYFFLNPTRAVAWELWLHTTMAALTMYLLSRLGLRLGPPAALVAGALFAFGGYQMAHTGLVWAVFESPWAPLAFLAVERSINGRWPWFLLGPPVVALSLLAGNPQEMYFSGIWLPLFAAVVVLTDPTRRRAGLGVAGLVVMVGGGFLMAAALVGPQLELAALGVRGGAGLSFGDASYAPLPAGTPLIRFLLPDYLSRFYGENAGWIGATGLGLVVLGLVHGLKRGHRLLIGFFTLMAGGCFVLALGAATPLYQPFFDHVPGMHLFRLPVRWVYVMTIATSALAGYGCELVASLVRARKPLLHQMAIPALGLVAVAVLYKLDGGHQALLFWQDRQHIEYASWVACGLVGVAVAGAFLLGPRALLLVPLAVVLELYAAGQFMEWNHPGAGDFYTYSRTIPQYVSAHNDGRVLPATDGGWSTEPDRLATDTPLSIGASSLVGFSTPWPTLQDLPVEDQVVGDVLNSKPGEIRPGLWQLLDVQYIVAGSDQAVIASSPTVTRVITAGDAVLYQTALPPSRVWSLCGAQFETDHQVVVDKVLAPGFTPGDLYVEGSGVSTPSAMCGSASLTQTDLNQVGIN
ncbi:MAG TPA: hypothetical protein VG015_09555, partial [Candidatus Dormibacteraeota bacterium]|nr:hypothetical protein [Candidatus Dormibacteraeota bacterium]